MAGKQWPPSRLDAKELRAADWSYLAEGGKSLVLRYSGERSAGSTAGWLNNNGTRALAIRLAKTSKESETNVREPNGSVSSPEHRLDFERHVVPTLLQSNSLLPYSCVLTLPQPDGSFLDEISAKIERDRPESRRKATQIDLSALTVVAVEDLSWQSSSEAALCLEIKPKWLFGTGTVSRYRKHQVLKKAGNISHKAFQQLYEPLDMVSGNADRIDRAARGLVHDWVQGGNNLRVFAGGKTVNAEDARLAEIISEFPTLPSNPSGLSARLTSILASGLGSPVMQSVLSRLSHLQSSLSPVNIQQLAAWWSMQTGGQQIGEANSRSADLVQQPTVAEYVDFVRSRQELDALEQSGQASDAMAPALTLRQAVLGALLSATFKDCSLFLRLTPRTRSSNSSQDQGRDGSAVELDATMRTGSQCDGENAGSLASSEPSRQQTSETSTASALLPEPSPATWSRDFDLCVNIIDVDPKPLSKLGHWKALDDEIESFYADWCTRVGAEGGLTETEQLAQ
ncbi:unnamed protein product [Parajaminaea phylloscopi]